MEYTIYRWSGVDHDELGEDEHNYSEGEHYDIPDEELSKRPVDAGTGDLQLDLAALAGHAGLGVGDIIDAYGSLFGVEGYETEYIEDCPHCEAPRKPIEHYEFSMAISEREEIYRGQLVRGDLDRGDKSKLH